MEETQKLLAMSGPLSDTLKWLLSHLNGSMVRREMYGHGIGRFSKDEVYNLMEKDMRTLATLLGRTLTVFVFVCTSVLGKHLCSQLPKPPLLKCQSIRANSHLIRA